jgi:hypothetical protein
MVRSTAAAVRLRDFRAVCGLVSGLLVSVGVSAGGGHVFAAMGCLHAGGCWLRGRCGAADADDLGVVTSHQLMDAPAATAVLTQYDEHAVACRCGRVHAASAPAGADEAGTVTYGPNLQAWCVFLLVMHHIPVKRCAQIIEALTGTRPSEPGTAPEAGEPGTGG